MRFDYCPHCGSKASEREIGDEGLMPFCEKCSRPLFDMFSVCVLCVAVSDEGKIALIKQNNVTDHYVGVAGYIKPGESAEQAALREVGEELGLEVIGAKWIKSLWYDKKDMLMLGFEVRVKQGELKPSCEVDLADWFEPKAAVGALREGSLIWQLAKIVAESIGSGE